MIKAIIFDFDGVLVKSENPRFDAIKKAAAKHGINISDNTFQEMIGITTRNFLARILPDNEKHLIEIIFEDFKKDFKDNILSFVEPISTTIDFIKNYNGNVILALASMNTQQSIVEVTKHYGIYEKFQSIVSVDDVTHHKPNPEVYIKSAASLHLPPAECIAIEDTTIGAQAALSAGMECAIILNGINSKNEFSDLQIKCFISSHEDLEILVA